MASPAFSLVRKELAAKLHADEVFFRQRVCRKRLNILLKAANEAVVPFNFLRKVSKQLIFQTVLLALMVSFQQLQAGNVYIQIHLLPDAVIPAHSALISAYESAVSSTSSQERTGDLEVMIWLMKRCLFSTVCQR